MPKRISSVSFFGVRNWRGAENQLQEILPDETISAQEYVALESLRSDLQEFISYLETKSTPSLNVTVWVAGRE